MTKNTLRFRAALFAAPAAALAVALAHPVGATTTLAEVASLASDGTKENMLNFIGAAVAGLVVVFAASYGISWVIRKVRQAAR